MYTYTRVSLIQSVHRLVSATLLELDLPPEQLVNGRNNEVGGKPLVPNAIRLGAMRAETRGLPEACSVRRRAALRRDGRVHVHGGDAVLGHDRHRGNLYSDIMGRSDRMVVTEWS